MLDELPIEILEEILTYVRVFYTGFLSSTANSYDADTSKIRPQESLRGLKVPFASGPAQAIQIDHDQSVQ